MMIENNKRYKAASGAACLKETQQLLKASGFKTIINDSIESLISDSNRPITV